MAFSQGIELSSPEPLASPGGSGLAFPFRVFCCFCGALPAFLFLAVLLVNPVFSQNLPSFSASITSGSSEQKRDALFQIRNLRSEIASREALTALSDSDPMVRATAAAAVVFLPKPEAVTALSPLLADKDPFVRKEAAFALGLVQSPDAAAALIELLRREKDLEIRSAAAIALGASGNPAAIEPLLSVLNSRPNEDNEFLRRSAARSIGQIAQIVKTSKAYVVTPQNFLPERFKTSSRDDLELRLPIYTAAIPVLSSILQSKNESDDARREAAFALGAIGNTNAEAVLRSHQNSPDPYLAEITKEALLKLGLRE
jgi:HEAT repeat protein